MSVDTNTTVVAETLAQKTLRLAELEIRERYPHLVIIEGSMIHHVEGKFAGKRTVRVQCPHCPAIVERATSDLHTFKGCPVCLKAVRKAEKSAKKLNLAAASARFELEKPVAPPAKSDDAINAMSEAELLAEAERLDAESLETVQAS